KQAYDTLSVEAKRSAYDENRRRNLLDDPLQTAQEIWKNYIKGVLH
ncbi:MAG: J domain-containing protein, partial [Oxalobacteraceae bacterium]